jgi:hypothetical protein
MSLSPPRQLTTGHPNPIADLILGGDDDIEPFSLPYGRAIGPIITAQDQVSVRTRMCHHQLTTGTPCY